MANKPKTAAAEASEQENLPAVQSGGALAMPDFLKDYQGPLGTESIETEDVNIPRLKLAQGLTPEVKDKLVNDGDLFHSITKQIIIPQGQTGLVIPVAYSKEYILWRDRKDGGGIFARAKRVLHGGEVRYAWDKPNSSFEHKLQGTVKVIWKTREFIDQDGLDKFGSSFPQDGESQPAATAHFNYIMALPDFDYTLVAVSFARSSAKKAKDLNAMLKMGGAPMFARVFQLGAVPAQNEQGDRYFNYSVMPAGFIQDATAFQNLRRLHQDLSAKSFDVDWSDEEGGQKSAAAAQEAEAF